VGLEERVSVLEQEVKILKNEIQSTLLEIQEQILAQRYPSLRSEDTSPLHAAAPSQEADSVPAWMKLVQEEPVVAADGKGGAQRAPRASADILGEVLEWVGQTVEQIGLERTKRIIDIYVTNQHLPASVRDGLLQVVALSTAEGEPEQVSVPQIVEAMTRLNELIGQGMEVQDALSALEEGDIG